MVSENLFIKKLGSGSHLPTWFFIIGYPVYWLQLYVFPARDGITSLAAWGAFVLIFGAVAGVSLTSLRGYGKGWLTFWNSLNGFEQFLSVSGFIICALILIITLLAGLLPIHLFQESDCLKYHYTLPRQHLILGSFAHIPWAADDLFLLPMDFALAPFWFATILLNKIPQLLITLGLLVVIVRLTFRLAGSVRWAAGVVVIFAFLGSHGIGIQMGTGMLDLAIAYLFFACFDSFCQGAWVFGAIEFCFFFWSKPLMPIQVLVVGLILVILVNLARYARWSILQELQFKNIKKGLLLFVVLSLFVGGPFVLKSIDYAGTPFYPLAPGVLGNTAKIKPNPVAWNSLQNASDLWMNKVKDNYGHGRGLVAFIKHWWLLAIPEKGVTNSFDYPMGLPYLLLIVPFLFYFYLDICRREVSLMSLFVVIAWGLWWFGSQQARFLYIPLIMVFIISSVRLKDKLRWLLPCLVVSLGLNLFSLWGANKHDIFLSPDKVLGAPERGLVQMSQDYLRNHRTGYVKNISHDVAYAQFPVVVIKEELPHTIAF